MDLASSGSQNIVNIIVVLYVPTYMCFSNEKGILFNKVSDHIRRAAILSMSSQANYNSFYWQLSNPIRP